MKRRAYDGRWTTAKAIASGLWFLFLIAVAVLAVEQGVALAESGGQDAGVRVYLTRDQAFREIFPKAAQTEEDQWTLRAAQIADIEADAHVVMPDSSGVSYRVFDADHALFGYAMVVEERGKYRPITFMVGVAPDFSVRGVEVMVYREDRGDEVRYRRFLRQYEGKTGRDPIRTHRDIVNITGATISVNSLNRGVRRAIATLEAVYRKAP